MKKITIIIAVLLISICSYAGNKKPAGRAPVKVVKVEKKNPNDKPIAAPDKKKLTVMKPIKK